MTADAISRSTGRTSNIIFEFPFGVSPVFDGASDVFISEETTRKIAFT